MASDFEKPNKIHTLYNYEVKEKMWPLPINELFGIGKKSTEKLLKLNIKTISDLANADIKKLIPYFKNQSRLMIDWANGIDDREVISKEVAYKGMSNEITLQSDITEKTKLYEHLLFLSDKLALRIRKENKYATVISVTLKDKYFKRRSHQKKIDKPANTTEAIYENAKKILDEMWNDDSVRLIGIRLDKLTDKIVIQKSLFDDEIKEDNLNLEKTVDKLKEKYGMKVIGRASLKDRKDVRR